MQPRKALILFSLVNAVVVLSCTEFWREGQSFARMVIVGVVSLPICNLAAWLGWRMGSRR